jgi:hypothetical protein
LELFKQQPLPFVSLSALIPMIGYLLKCPKRGQGNALLAHHPGKAPEFFYIITSEADMQFFVHLS